MAIVENKSERIEVRMTPKIKALLQHAAVLSRQTVTEFLLNAGIAAEHTLAERIFRLDEQQWQAFQDILDRPVADKPRLARLLVDKGALERLNCPGFSGEQRAKQTSRKLKGRRIADA